MFCKIVTGKIPSRKVYEDDHSYAFLDINPRNPGHTLIVPRRHYRWVWDMPGDELAQLYKTAGKIADAQREHFDTDMVVSLVIGDEVPHAHVWLVPRFPNDGHGNAIKLELVKDIPDEEMDRIAEKLRAQLSEE